MTLKENRNLQNGLVVDEKSLNLDRTSENGFWSMRNTEMVICMLGDGEIRVRCGFTLCGPWWLVFFFIKRNFITLKYQEMLDPKASHK